jgi:hypothetical protein
MTIIESGLFFIAAALTDLALTQTGGHNLAVGAGVLQIIALVLLVWGIGASLRTFANAKQVHTAKEENTKK